MQQTVFCGVDMRDTTGLQETHRRTPVIQYVVCFNCSLFLTRGVEALTSIRFLQPQA